MTRLEVDHYEESLIVLSLVLLESLLSASKYPQPIQDEMRKRTISLIERIQKKKEYDSYGNQY